jgi:hypothetical protein
MVSMPGRQVHPSEVLPGGVARFDGRPPTLDHQEQANADLPLLECGLATFEIEDGHAEVGDVQRTL